ncbi:uncharacterized protein VTP21DRAFT_9509 [Calcarisporiella thermophila]|uniref:uncharacterized protein n=1 Tax=Calcarisporiella thermophila TaxID=911321 RepID=UPI003743FF9F
MLRSLLYRSGCHACGRTFVRMPQRIAAPPSTSSSSNFYSPLRLPSTFTSRLYATSIKRPQIDESGKVMTLDITDRAAQRLLDINKKENTTNQMLRVLVESGGCHGFQVRFELSDQVEDQDAVFENNGARVIVDEMSLSLINGSKIDFTQELIGSQFQLVENPNATQGCGCGVSFDIKI